MKELLEYLLKNIINSPDKLEIEELVNEESGRKYITYNINADQDDIRIIIGKLGRTIKSISNILKIKAIKEGVFVDVRVNRPIEPKAAESTLEDTNTESEPSD